MMTSQWPILLLTISTVLAAPSSFYDDDRVSAPTKRAALVLDRLLVALQKALRDDDARRRYDRPDRDGPKTAPLRRNMDEVDIIKTTSQKASGPQQMLSGGEGDQLGRSLELEPRSAPVHFASFGDETSSWQPRRQGEGAVRGRARKCYFNAVTCF